MLLKDTTWERISLGVVSEGFMVTYSTPVLLHL
jgi:hypothetical protein